MEKTYLQLKHGVISDISCGNYKPHDRLPSQRDLGKQYALSHMSVRRAINELVSEGVIYARPGKGLYVAENKQEAELGPLFGFTEDMALRGMTASSRVLDADLVAASASLAHLLKVPVGAPLVYLRRLRLADDEPMAIQASYLPHALCPGLLGLLKEGQGQLSLFALLRQHYNLKLADGDTAAEAALASPEEAELLGLSLPAALFVTEQITFLDDGRPVEFVRSVYRGDRYRLHMAKGDRTIK